MYYDEKNAAIICEIPIKIVDKDTMIKVNEKRRNISFLFLIVLILLIMLIIAKRRGDSRLKKKMVLIFNCPYK